MVLLTAKLFVSIIWKQHCITSEVNSLESWIVCGSRNVSNICKIRISVISSRNSELASFKMARMSKSVSCSNTWYIHVIFYNRFIAMGYVFAIFYSNMSIRGSSSSIGWL